VYLHQGFHDTYQVSTGAERYVFRLYRQGWKPLRDIEGELGVINLLSQQELPVAYPIPDAEGRLIQSLDCPEGVRYGVLFRYAPGAPLPAFDTGSARLFGEHLARIHQVTAGRTFPSLTKAYEPDFILGFVRDALVSRLGEGSIAWQTLIQIETKLSQQLPPALLQTLPRGICHGDPHHENCHRVQETDTLTFFDFDFCGDGYFHYDLGSFFHYERQRPDVKEAFLAGYTAVRPLGEASQAIIPYFEVLMRLFHLGARAAHADGLQSPVWPVREIERTAREIQEQLAGLAAP